MVEFQALNPFLSEHPRVPVEEVLVEHGVVVAEVLGESRQARGRDLLEGGLVRLVADAATVQDAAVLGVHRVVVYARNAKAFQKGEERVSQWVS